MPYKNPEDQRACECRWRLNYPERNRAKVNKCNLALTLQVLTYYGGGKLACVLCDFPDMRALCIDHIDNNAHRERGGVNFYRKLKLQGFPKGYQTLCANCNLIKERERRQMKLK